MPKRKRGKSVAVFTSSLPLDNSLANLHNKMGRYLDTDVDVQLHEHDHNTVAFRLHVQGYTRNFTRASYHRNTLTGWLERTADGGTRLTVEKRRSPSPLWLLTGVLVLIVGSAINEMRLTGFLQRLNTELGVVAAPAMVGLLVLFGFVGAVVHRARDRARFGGSLTILLDAIGYEEPRKRKPN